MQLNIAFADAPKLAVPEDAYTLLVRFARRHKVKPWSPEQAIHQAAIKGIVFQDARAWGPIFERARREGVIRRAGLFSRVTSNGSVRPGWVGV